MLGSGAASVGVSALTSDEEAKMCAVKSAMENFSRFMCELIDVVSSKGFLKAQLDQYIAEAKKVVFGVVDAVDEVDKIISPSDGCYQEYIKLLDKFDDDLEKMGRLLGKEKIEMIDEWFKTRVF